MSTNGGPGTSVPGDYSVQADPGSAFTSGIASGVAAATTATHQLVDSAKSGGFSITEQGVEPLRKAIADMTAQLDSLTGTTSALDLPPQLGSHPYGQTVAVHDHKSAAAAPGSIQDVLSRFRDILAQADEALARAAGVYREGENQAIDAHKQGVSR